MSGKPVDEHLKDLYADVRLGEDSLARLAARLEVEKSSLAGGPGAVRATGRGWRKFLKGTLKNMTAAVGLSAGVLGAAYLGWIPGLHVNWSVPGAAPEENSALRRLVEAHRGAVYADFQIRRSWDLPEAFVSSPTFPTPSTVGRYEEFVGGRPFRIPGLDGANLRFADERGRRIDLFQLQRDRRTEEAGPAGLPVGTFEWPGGIRIRSWILHEVHHVVVRSRLPGSAAGWLEEGGRRVQLPRRKDLRSWTEATRAGRYTGKLFSFRGEGRRFGFHDESGREVVPPRYLQARTSREDRAAFMRDGLWGFLDLEGEEVVPPRYRKVGDFHEGLAAVELDGYWGYIDRDGDLAIPNRFLGEEVGDFHEGRAWVRTSDGYTYVDRYGRIAAHHRFEAARDYSCGRAAIKVRGQWGFIDWQGKPLFTGFDRVRDFKEYLAAVEVDGRWGVVDWQMKWILSPTLVGEHPISDFSEGLAVYLKDGKAGYLNEEGEPELPAQYGLATRFHQGLALVTPPEGGSPRYLRRNGEILDEANIGMARTGVRGKNDPYSPNRYAVPPRDEDGRPRFTDPVAIFPELRVEGWYQAVLRERHEKGERMIRGWYDGDRTFTARGRKLTLTPVD